MSDEPEVVKQLRAEVEKLNIEIEPLRCEVAVFAGYDKELAASGLRTGALVEAFEAERDQLRAEVEKLRKLLPRCPGEWIGGSGGHRKYAGDCHAVGRWDVGVGFVCDAHLNRPGGDDDAWEWDKERDQLRAEIARLSSMTLVSGNPVTTAIVDQPPPIATDRRPAWEIVIEHVEKRRGDSAYTKTGDLDLVLKDMRERDLVGRQRYGTPLTSGNGRDHLIDAYQEILDACAYFANELDEHGVGPETQIDTTDSPEKWRLFCVQAMLWDHVHTAIRLRALIRETTEQRSHIEIRASALLTGERVP